MKIKLTHCSFVFVYRFVFVEDLFEPTDDGAKSQVTLISLSLMFHCHCSHHEHNHSHNVNYAKSQVDFESIMFVRKLTTNLFQTFITTSCDATTHFETACQDIKDVYRRCTGNEFDFSKVKTDEANAE